MNSRGTPMRFCALARHLFRVLSSRENAGVAAIEFAICATIFLTAVAGTVDIGLLLYTEFQLDTAVNAGTQYAINNASIVSDSSTTNNNLNTEITNLVNNMNGTTWASSTVIVNNTDYQNCYCPSGTPGNWSWGSSSTSCGSSCPSGGGVYGRFVTITANRSISPIFTAFGFVSNGTVSRSVIVETQ
jgi:Flp pilus assembly protein TadG